MYNRYIPQPDGSFKRKQVQDERSPIYTNRKKTDPVAPLENTHCEENEFTEPKSQSAHTSAHGSTRPQKRNEQPSIKLPEINAGTFLRNLIPRNLDTGDILIIVLLLLMSGDSREEQNNALLTLALYLFL